MRKAAILGAGPYDIPNVKIDTYGIYTNNTPSGAFRTFGAMQSQFATESISTSAPRSWASIRSSSGGSTDARRGGDAYRQKLGSVSSIPRCSRGREGRALGDRRAGIARGRRGDLGGEGNRAPCTLGARFAGGIGRKAARRRGRGVAASWYGIARTATVDRAGAWVEIDDGGTAKVITGVTEIGEGILTVLAQIAADELGIRPEDVTIGDNDTARTPEAAHAGATRQTYMIGNVVALAARDARSRLDP
jgi:aldehyde oxidoreductase